MLHAACQDYFVIPAQLPAHSSGNFQVQLLWAFHQFGSYYWSDCISITYTPSWHLHAIYNEAGWVNRCMSPSLHRLGRMRSPCNMVKFPRSPHNRHPDNKVHGANLKPTWVLSAPDWPHVGPMNIAIRVSTEHPWGLATGCLLCVQSLTYVLAFSLLATQITKTIRSTSIWHRLDIFMSDRCQIDIDLMVFVYNSVYFNSIFHGRGNE